MVKAARHNAYHSETWDSATLLWSKLQDKMRRLSSITSVYGESTLECVLRSHPGVTNKVTSSIFDIRPVPSSSDNFLPPLTKEGHVKVETVALSVDPYMRCMLDPLHPQLGEYLSPMELGQPLHGGGVGLVVESLHDNFPVGSLAVAPFLGYPWRTRATLDATDEHLNLRPVTFEQRPTLDLGAMGMPGVTSWFCMLAQDQGNPQPGETVVISGAAGACGSLAGQLAKIKGGARVVGVCGSDTKCDLLTSSLNFDGAVNYNSPTFRHDLHEQCPDGIDVYMDNVGGSVSEVALSLMNDHGRVPICGQISAYDDDVKYLDMVSEEGVRNVKIRNQLREKNVVRKRFLVLDYASKWEDALNELGGLIASGDIIIPETFDIGFDPGGAFVSMMNGGNFGKACNVVHPDFVLGGKRWVGAEGANGMKHRRNSTVWKW